MSSARPPESLVRRGLGWRAVVGIAAGMFVVGWISFWLVLRSDTPREAPPSPLPSSVARSEGAVSVPSISSPPTVAPAAVSSLLHFLGAGVDAGVPPPAAASAPPPELEQAQIDDIRTQARDLMTARLEQVRSAALSQCWPGAPGGAPQLGLTYAVTFDKEGRETSRAIQEGSSDVSPEIRNCLHNYPVPPFQIAPPGVTVAVDALISYP